MTLMEYASNGGKNILFGLPATEELRGRSAVLPEGVRVSFGDELAVKCDDDLFLAEKEGRLLLIEELPDESLKALDVEKTAGDSAALPNALEGWETDLCLASGWVLTALFRDGTLILRPSPEPVVVNVFGGGETPAPQAPAVSALPPLTLSLQAAETGDKRFLLRFPETGETLFFDARRFLLYALAGGRIVAGFVEVPPKE